MATLPQPTSTCAVVYLIFLLLLTVCETRYHPTWESLDSRSLPAWYDEGKIGIFMHWGVFSVPSVSPGAWLWWYLNGPSPDPSVQKFMKDNYSPRYTYADLAAMFTAEFFNPDEWADIFKASGARYVVLTSKHHEGFTNWPSNVSFNWNAMDVGPKRDLVGSLANSIRKRTSIHFGLYHSLFEWFHPQYLIDKKNNFKTQSFVRTKTMPELYEIVNAYKPDVIWSDGDWEADYGYWNSTEFIAWLYNDSPVKDTVVTNDRWGIGTTCKHGGFFTCSDRYNPGILQKHKWENALTLDKSSWGYRRNAQLEDYLTMDNITQLLAETISCGGNMLINIGPTHDGLIKPIFEERLRQLGQWLGVNGEAIYSSVPWVYQNDTMTKGVWYTTQTKVPGTVYAIVLDWPDNVLKLGAPEAKPGSTQVTLLGYEGTFIWHNNPSGGIAIDIPPIPFDKIPCEWAWVFKLTNLQTSDTVRNSKVKIVIQ